MLIRPGVLTPANDPLKGVAQVWRDLAIDAVIKGIEPDYQSEALVQLRMINHYLMNDYRNELVTEDLAETMNQRIREHVTEWVQGKRAMGLTQMQVEPFLFEVKIKQDEYGSSFYVEYPEVYGQLERRTAPYDFVSIDKYTLHAMAKEWLDAYPPFIDRSIPVDSIFFESPELNDLFGKNKGLKPGEFWAVGALPRFTSEMVFSDLMLQLQRHKSTTLLFNPQVDVKTLAESVIDPDGGKDRPVVVFLTGLGGASKEDIQGLRNAFRVLNIAVLAHIPLNAEAVQLEKYNAVLWQEAVLGQHYWRPYMTLSGDVDGELLVCPDWFGTSVFRGKHRGNPESGKLAAVRLVRDSKVEK